MTINPGTRFPTKTAAATPGYPYGSARNVTISGDGTGTPWEQAVINDIWGVLFEILDRASITPNNTPDQVGASQFVTALLDSGIIEDAAISDMSLDKLTDGLATITVGNYDMYFGPEILRFTNTSDSSILDIRAGTGSSEEAISYTSGNSGVKFIVDYSGAVVEADPGATYSLSMLNTGKGISHKGGPGLQPLHVRTTGYITASAWTTWTVDSGTSRIYYCSQDLTLTGIPWGSLIYNAVMTYTSVGGQEITAPVRIACKNVGGVTVVDSVIAMIYSDPSSGSGEKLWVTFGAALVD